MIELQLTLQTVAPLALRASRTSTQFTPTLKHIPGVTIRGAFAMEYLRQIGKAEDLMFKNLFLSEAVSFGPLFPSEAGFPGRPLPASAVACKRFGIKEHSQKKDPEKKYSQSVGDSLLRMELADILQSLLPLEEWERCPDCKSAYPSHSPNKRDRLDGFYTKKNDFDKPKADTRMLPGVGISRLTHTAAQGLLFSMEALEEDQHFTGSIRLNGNDTQVLKSTLQNLAPQDGFLRLGGARSRGQGRVRITQWQENAQDNLSLLNDRWLQLNKAVQKVWKDNKVPLPDAEYFTLTLESPTILLNPCMHQIHPDELKPVHFGLPEGVELRRKLLTEVNLQGWNAAWQLPKYDTPALGMGSVFLFRASADLRQSIQERLIEIETYGLGEQRNEGLGCARPCDPFHYQFEV